MTLHLLAFMSFGFTEILVVGVVALLVFGGRLPEVMRNVGQAYARFRQGLHEISKPVRDELRSVTDVTQAPSYSTPRARRAPARTESAGSKKPAEPVEETPVTEAPRSRPAPDWMDDEPPPV